MAIDQETKFSRKNLVSGRPPLSTWRYWWALIRCHPGTYLATATLRIVIFAVAFQAIGLVQRYYFDALTEGQAFGLSYWSWAGLFVAVVIVRNVLIMSDMYFFFSWEFKTGAVLRKNLLESILNRPGARALPNSTGEAVSRFRGDADEVGNFTTWALFIIAQALFAIFAIWMMLQINPRITLLAFTPLLLVVVVANIARTRVQTYREASRGATGQVTGFIGEMFDSVQAVKANTAEARMLAHFHELNEARRQSTLKDRLFSEVLTAIFRNTSSVGTGLILLLAVNVMQDGSFTIGDFTLFVYYLNSMTDLTAQVGIFIPRLKQADVAFERMNKLLQGEPPETLVKPTPAYLSGPLPPVPYVAKQPADHLETLNVRGLTYAYPDSENGIFDIDLVLPRGSLTVITGQIGSGKTTLLRTLLGLLPKEGGEICWNGKAVENPATFFVPPRVAYTSQIPWLFSETLQDNILLGLPEAQAELSQAIHAAVMEQDLVHFEQGLETVIGPRGVRLSGGQRQRSAAARMFVRQPELLVFDDLSSALDVNTERIMWERLFAQSDVTCLAVSHREAVLQRADHVILLKDGRVEDAG